MHETLIVRLPNWLGDTVMAVPALRALRTARPEARIVLVGPWATGLSGQALADVLVPYARAWSARLGRWDEIRAFGASTAVLLPNSLEAAIAAWYWKAARRIGFDAGARGRLLTDAIPMPEPREHQIDEYARVIARLGVDVGRSCPAAGTAGRGVAGARGRARPPAGGPASTPAAAGSWASISAPPMAPPSSGRPSASPSSVGPSRPMATCRCCSGLATTSSSADRLALDTGARSLVGRDGPELLTALLTEVDAVVCGDTGVGHLAAALGTPVTALFGPTDPRAHGPARPRARPLPSGSVRAVLLPHVSHRPSLPARDHRRRRPGRR